MDIKTELKRVKKGNITNNTQRIAAKLLRADGKWVSRSQFAEIPSAPARIRDLRKPQFGSFSVECKTSTELGKKADKRTFYYRIDPAVVTQEQVTQVFRLNEPVRKPAVKAAKKATGEKPVKKPAEKPVKKPKGK